jgi:GNAT superfamily N-acetyltransferase
MTTLILRDAQPEDKDAIRAITLAAYQQYEPLLGPLWKLYLQNIEETLADVGPAEQIVAEQDGQLVGTTLLYPPGAAFDDPAFETESEPAPEVRLLAVPPQARGLGVGKALMEECVRRARGSGVKSLTLHTNEIMAVAKAMYERMGFQHAPELDFRPTPEILIKGYRYNLE